MTVKPRACNKRDSGSTVAIRKEDSKEILEMGSMIGGGALSLVLYVQGLCGLVGVTLLGCAAACG